jgi:hypothetical protein
VLDLTIALVGPIAKLLLKSWLGDTGSEIGWNILEIAKKRFDDRGKAFEAQRRAARVAELVAKDMASGLAVERSRENDVLAAAYELGITIESHVSATLLINSNLDVTRIRKTLVEARPIGTLYSKEDPALGYYYCLIDALAPHLRNAATGFEDYRLERDAKVLQNLNEINDVTREASDAIAWIKLLLSDQGQKAVKGEMDGELLYRKALRSEVRTLRLFGVDLSEDTPTDLPLSIAYIPLGLNLAVDREGPSLSRLCGYLDYSSIAR